MAPVTQAEHRLSKRDKTLDIRLRFDYMSRSQSRSVKDAFREGIPECASECGARGREDTARSRAARASACRHYDRRARCVAGCGQPARGETRRAWCGGPRSLARRRALGTTTPLGKSRGGTPEGERAPPGARRAFQPVRWFGPASFGVPLPFSVQRGKRKKPEARKKSRRTGDFGLFVPKLRCTRIAGTGTLILPRLRGRWRAQRAGGGVKLETSLHQTIVDARAPPTAFGGPPSPLRAASRGGKVLDLASPDGAERNPGATMKPKGLSWITLRSSRLPLRSIQATASRSERG